MAWIDQQGYVRVRHQGRETREHRVVAEQMLGRPLLTSEHVHHRNGVKTDNRPENLEVVDNRSHQLKHWQEGHYDARVKGQTRPPAECAECGEVGRIHGQGKCRRCYMRAAQAKYAEKNPEKTRERHRRYRAENKELVAERKRARRAQGKKG